MAHVPRPGSKGYRDGLRARLLALGFTDRALVEQLAMDLISRCNKRPREAWRLANEPSLDEAAARYNAVSADPNASMRKGRLWDFEQWPSSGVRPTLRTLRRLAGIFGTSWDQLVDLEDLANMPEEDRDAYHAMVAARHRSAAPTANRPRSAAVTNASTVEDRSDYAGSAAKRADTAEPDDEMAAWELARRVEASDVGAATVCRLESAVDDLAMAYPVTPPAKLLGRVRRHLGYVSHLLEGRTTLAEHRRLLVAGGWLSLLGATVDIDLHQRDLAAARLHTAAQLAKQADHPELLAWCLETTAWQVLTDHDYRRALALSQAAQRVAPRSSSAYLQATAQEGRAWARLGEKRQTYQVLNKLTRLAEALPAPEHPEHHYVYDPAKAVAYTATTLSWVGDAAAERYARDVISRLESNDDGVRRPRRMVSARLDLALALLAAGKPCEAAHTALAAMRSGRLVPSNFWRAHEIVTAVEALGHPEATDLRDTYETLSE